MTSNTWLNWDVQVISEDVSAEATHGTFCIVKDEDEIFVPEVTEHYLEESHSEDTMQNGEWKVVQMSQVTKQPTSTPSTERVKCPECAKTLTSSAYLREHMRIHTGEKPYACHECGQAFAQKCNLRMHKRVHTGERPFMCGICGRAFSRASHLKGHMLQHTGDKPYSCDQCGQQFTNSQGRKNHMKLHLGERPFQCEICNVTFVHKPSLKAHIKTHRREARYYCSICKRKFIFRSALYEHMTFHSKNKLYECDQCNKRFKHKNYLKKHKSSICASRSLLRDGGLESGGTQEPVHLKYRVLSANERALPDYIDSDEETGDVGFSQVEENEGYLDAAFTKLLRRSGYQP